MKVSSNVLEIWEESDAVQYNFFENLQTDGLGPEDKNQKISWCIRTEVTIRILGTATQTWTIMACQYYNSQGLLSFEITST